MCHGVMQETRTDGLLGEDILVTFDRYESPSGIRTPDLEGLLLLPQPGCCDQSWAVARLLAENGLYADVTGVTTE